MEVRGLTRFLMASTVMNPSNRQQEGLITEAAHLKGGVILLLATALGTKDLR